MIELKSFTLKIDAIGFSETIKELVLHGVVLGFSEKKRKLMLHGFVSQIIP